MEKMTLFSDRGFKSVLPKVTRKKLELRLKKGTFLPKVRVLYNFEYKKYFDFVYEKVEILQKSIFLTSS